MSDNKTSRMSSSKPYLMDALYQWIVDNRCTPYVLVNAYVEGVEVPQEHVRDGQIVLNIAPHAVMNLVIDKQGMRFNARFGGIPMDIAAPLNAILGIYAKENGQGMMFEEDPGPAPVDDPPGKPKLVSSNKNESKEAARPSLKVIK